MSGGDYVWHRKVNQGYVGSVAFGTTGVSGATVGTILSGAASGAIHVQRGIVRVTTGSSGVTWQLQDGSTGSALKEPFDMSIAGVGFPFDFGDRGLQLTTGNSLVVSGSASGAAGVIDYEGYIKYMGGTSVGLFPASGASGTTP